MDQLRYLASAAVVLLAIFVVFRKIVRHDYQRHGRLKPRSAAAEWAVCVLWAGFSYAFLDRDWPAIRVGPVLRFAGWALIVGGTVFFVASFFWLGVRRAHGLEVDQLKRTGPYRWTRNPQIVGFVLGFVGFVLLWPSWHMAVSLALMLVFAHVMVLTEEEHLRSLHGDAYRRYCDRVPRYLARRR